MLKTTILILSLSVIYAFVVEAWAFLYANGAPLALNWMTYGFGLYLLLYLKTGRFYAVVLAVFFNTVFIVLALSFALKKYGVMPAYCKQGCVTAWHAYQTIAGYLGRSFIFFTQVATSPSK